jgi:DNA polymerase-3 subunit gamma/tau
VLARKWRPQKFSDLIGQEHITRTLQNTITQKRVGHAYLFVGSRGIGKTSVARIFAKALNCEGGPETGTEPCCTCQACREIASGASIDVIEIDGASHNKVEHIRDIRDNVIYTPSRCRYKIYIIDEVHMLTNAAWNALLKTLEEPPPHVKFLFATTEPHKVLPTVVSRCQRFDLRRIPVSLIVQRLQQIAGVEQVNIDDRALAAIARGADGGMRDALSMFDQIIAFCGGRTAGEMIVEKDIIDVFGLASGTELKQMVEAILRNDIPGVMTVIQGLADHGRDLERLYGDLVNYVRNLMVATTCPDPERLLEVSPTEIADLLEIGRRTSPHFVPRILQGLIDSEPGIRYALNKRIYLEAAAVRIMRETHSLQIDDLISRLNQLRDGGLDIPIALTPAAAPQANATTSAPIQAAVPAAPAQNPTAPPPVQAAPVAPAPLQAKATPPVQAAPPVQAPIQPAPAVQAAPKATPPAPAQTPAKPAPEKAQTPVAKPVPAPIQAPAPVQAATPAHDSAPAPQVPVQAASVPAPTPVQQAPVPKASASKVDSAPAAAPAAAPARAVQAPPALPVEPIVDEEPDAPLTTRAQTTPPAPAPSQDQADAPPWDTDSAEPAKYEDPSAACDGPDIREDAERPPFDYEPEGQEIYPEEWPEQAVPAPAPVAAAPSPEGSQEPVTLWNAVLAEIAKTPEGFTLLPILQELRPVSFIRGTLLIGYSDTFSEKNLELVSAPAHKKLVEDCFAKVSPGAKSRIRLKRWLAGISNDDVKQSNAVSPEVRERVEAAPFVQKVKDLFGGDIIDVRG